MILPFRDMASVFGESVNGRCPVCGKVFTTGEVSENAADMLTEHLFVLLKDRKNIELIPSSSGPRGYVRTAGGKQKRVDRTRLAA